MVLPIESTCGRMYERNVCQGVILEEIVDLAFDLRKIVVIGIESGLEASRDHLDAYGVPENTFLSILKQNRVFAFFRFRHLLKEGDVYFISDLAAANRFYQ